ncbi:hypothetical protein Tco_0479299 [Tanacetum coccineum]
MSREKNTSSDGYTTGCGMQCSNRSDLPSRVGMNPRRFPEADHSHGCVTDGLITVPDDHQLNGEVEIPIVVTTNTTPGYGSIHNVREAVLTNLLAMLQRTPPEHVDHGMLRAKLLNPVTRETEDLQGQIDHAGIILLTVKRKWNLQNGFQKDLQNGFQQVLGRGHVHLQPQHQKLLTRSLDANEFENYGRTALDSIDPTAIP